MAWPTETSVSRFWRLEGWDQGGSTVRFCWVLPCGPAGCPLPAVSSHGGRRAHRLSGISSYEGVMPWWEPHPMTSSNSNNLPKPHLQMPSYWGADLQHMDFRGHKHSIHSIYRTEILSRWKENWGRNQVTASKEIEAEVNREECLKFLW